MTKETSAETQLVYFKKCEQIKKFDILVADRHNRNDSFTRLDCSTGLTLQEVWNWLCEGGDWAYRITAHDQPDRVFLSGVTYFENCLKHANEGEELIHLCFANDDEVTDFKNKVKARHRKELKLE